MQQRTPFHAAQSPSLTRSPLIVPDDDEEDEIVAVFWDIDLVGYDDVKTIRSCTQESIWEFLIIAVARNQTHGVPLKKQDAFPLSVEISERICWLAKQRFEREPHRFTKLVKEIPLSGWEALGGPINDFFPLGPASGRFIEELYELQDWLPKWRQQVILDGFNAVAPFTLSPEQADLLAEEIAFRKRAVWREAYGVGTDSLRFMPHALQVLADGPRDLEKQGGYTNGNSWWQDDKGVALSHGVATDLGVEWKFGWFHASSSNTASKPDPVALIQAAPIIKIPAHRRHKRVTVLVVDDNPHTGVLSAVIANRLGLGIDKSGKFVLGQTGTDITPVRAIAIHYDLSYERRPFPRTLGKEGKYGVEGALLFADAEEVLAARSRRELVQIRSLDEMYEFRGAFKRGAHTTRPPSEHARHPVGKRWPTQPPPAVQPPPLLDKPQVLQRAADKPLRWSRQDEAPNISYARGFERRGTPKPGEEVRTAEYLGTTVIEYGEIDHMWKRILNDRSFVDAVRLPPHRVSSALQRIGASVQRVVLQDPFGRHQLFVATPSVTLNQLTKPLSPEVLVPHIAEFVLREFEVDLRSVTHTAQVPKVRSLLKPRVQTWDASDETQPHSLQTATALQDHFAELRELFHATNSPYIEALLIRSGISRGARISNEWLDILADQLVGYLGELHPLPSVLASGEIQNETMRLNFKASRGETPITFEGFEIARITHPYYELARILHLNPDLNKPQPAKLLTSKLLTGWEELGNGCDFGRDEDAVLADVDRLQTIEDIRALFIDTTRAVHMEKRLDPFRREKISNGIFALGMVLDIDVQPAAVEGALDFMTQQLEQVAARSQEHSRGVL